MPESSSAAPAALAVREVKEIPAESTRTGKVEEARLVRGATLGRRGALAGLLLATGFSAAMASGAAGLFACTLCYRPLAAGTTLGFRLAAGLQLPGRPASRLEPAPGRPARATR